MSTYLQLLQDLHRESGAAGVAPSAVTGLRGEAARLAGYIVQADQLVQDLWVNWKFLWTQFTSSNTTTAGTATLAAPTNLNYWDFDTFRIVYPGETDQHPIEAVEYNEIRTEVLDTSEATPARVIVMNDSSLRFEPVPNGIYTIIADYWKKPTLLAAASDISAIPPQYHLVILGRGLMLYGEFEDAPEVEKKGIRIYEQQLARLENRELPNKQNARFRMGGSFEVIAE